MNFQQTLQAARIVGILRASNPESAYQAGLASIRAGLKVLEVTFTVPGVLEVLKALKKELPQALLGIGTVMNAAQGQEAIAAGATFLVSPHLDEELLGLAQEARVPYLPGVLSPTEIARALRLGANVLKIFPIAPVGGVAYLKDLRGPFPTLQALVTGGVSPAEVNRYLAAGALAVGLGSQLFPQAALAQKNWATIEEAVRGALQATGGTA